MYNAQRCNLDTITICEDDCRFKPDFNKKYNIIKNFLNKIDKWDIFVGWIALLPEETIIHNVYEYDGLTFLEIDKMHSTVFNIYNKSVYDIIQNWNVNNRNVNINTIDQYLKRQKIKIITTYPFEFDCLDVNSTLWNKNLYNEYNNMFNYSLKLIKKKLAEYKRPIIKL